MKGHAMNTHLHPMFRSIVNTAVNLAGAPSMSSMPLLSEHSLYTRKLQQHDWHFEYSDDGHTYRRGRAEREELTALQARLDHDFGIWNAHCDPSFRRVPA
jgi:hypothetical protein